MAKSYLFKNFTRLIFLLFVSSSAFAHDYLFIENKGQWESNILFKSSIPGGNLIVSKSGLAYEFFDTKALYELHHLNYSNEQSSRKSQSEIKQVRVNITFKNNATFSQIQ